jgi:hypothetical protein
MRSHNIIDPRSIKARAMNEATGPDSTPRERTMALGSIAGTAVAWTVFWFVVPDWPLFALAGAVGGLIYWLVAFSAAPGGTPRLPTDASPLGGGGGWRLRRRAAVLVAVVAVAAGVTVADGWWQRRIVRSPDAGLPRVAFEREWRTRGWLGLLAWSSDGAEVVSLSGNGPWLAAWDPAGGSHRERKEPRVAALLQTVGDARIVATPAFGSRDAFVAFDAATGEVLHHEPDPAPGSPGLPGPAVALALSADGTTLAVGYGMTRPGVPVVLYATGSPRSSCRPAAPAGCPCLPFPPTAVGWRSAAGMGSSSGRPAPASCGGCRTRCTRRRSAPTAACWPCMDGGMASRRSNGSCA